MDPTKQPQVRYKDCPICKGTGVSRYDDNDCCSVCEGYGRVLFDMDDYNDEEENARLGNYDMMKDS